MSTERLSIGLQPDLGAADFLKSLRERGIQLWQHEGQLRYKAPKGTLTREQINRLKSYKAELVALVDSEAAHTTPRCRLDPAPLSFSQLAHWHQFRLAQRPAIRQIAHAVRLLGDLNVDAVRGSLEALVARDSSLRTRIELRDGTPVQMISQSGELDYRLLDLTSLPADLRESEVGRLIEQLILEPIDVAVGPLLGVRLLRLRPQEHVLILAMEHIISDAFSMGILLRDFFSAYQDIVRGQPVCLPELPIQFVDYALRQRSGPQSWIERHRVYWDEHFAGCRRLRFPSDSSASAATEPGWGTVPVRIEQPLKAALLEACRARRTTLAMGVLTAYAAVLLRWCDVDRTVIQYQSDGRFSPQFQNTIGFFAFALHLRIDLLDSDSFIDLLRRVEDEYCAAHEHADQAFIETQRPGADFVHNSGFNWIPRGITSDLYQVSDVPAGLTCSTIPFEHPMLRKLEWDSEPGVLLHDTEEGIVGGIHFSQKRFSRQILERFGRDFLVFLEGLIRHPEQCLNEIPISRCR